VSTQVVVKVRETGADAERLSDLATALRTELLNLEVEYVDHARGATVPPGARGIDAVDAGVLVASLTTSAEIGRHLIASVQAWLRRGGDNVPRSVELKIGDHAVTITDATREQQDELIAGFLRSVQQP